MSSLTVIPISQLKDNYAYLVHEPTRQLTAVVDPAEPAPILDALKERAWKLNLILNTHHHTDHVGGNLALKATTKAQVVGNAADKARIPGIDLAVPAGSFFSFGPYSIQAVAANGHTQGHLLYWLAQQKLLFTGDTLFLMGCGRLFECEARALYESLLFIKSLPPDTLIYCGHEYSLKNAQFALTVDPQNRRLQDRKKSLETAAQKTPSVPATLEEELATNPFLRTQDPNIRKQLGMETASEVEVFAELRKRKDNF